MTHPAPRGARVSRESRLLLITVAVCAVVLLVLARLRFPDTAAVDSTAPPLERLAARASYDGLAADIQRVEPIIAPNFIVLRLAPHLRPGPHDIRDVLARPDSPSGVRHVAALRITADTALALIDEDVRIDGIVGATEGTGAAAVVAIDRVRGIARVRVPDAPVRELSQLPLTSLQTPVYVVVVEGTQAGATLRPVFLGRGDRFGSSRWARPLLPLGGIAVSPGALLFTLAGEFIGTAVMENGAPAIAGARDVIDAAQQLASAPRAVPADLGASLQPLTPALAAALSVQRGVVVAEIDPDGAAQAAGLEPGDAITAVDDWSSDSPDELLLRLAARAPGETVNVAIVRNGQPRSVPVTLAPAKLDSSGEAAAGLRPGDIVTRAGETDTPTQAQLRRVLARPTPSGFTVLIVRRDGRQRVVAVPVAGRSDAAGR